MSQMSPKKGQGVSLKFSVVANFIEDQLDVIETKRLLRKLPYQDDLGVTLEEILGSVEELLDADLDDCIKSGFNKLNTREMHELWLQPLQQALLSYCKQTAITAEPAEI